MNRITCLATPNVSLDGINEKGVACAIFTSYQGGDNDVATDQKMDKLDIISITMFRLILDYGTNDDEDVELVNKYELHDSANTSFHYMVADASGRSAILKWVSGTNSTDKDDSKRELVVTYDDSNDTVGEREANASYQWVTNFIVNNGYYENDEEKHGLDQSNNTYDKLFPTNALIKGQLCHFYKSSDKGIIKRKILIVQFIVLFTISNKVKKSLGI